MTSCDAARTSVSLDVTGIVWKVGTPWAEGAVGELRMRYENGGGHDVHYLGVGITPSTDAVVLGSDSRLGEDGTVYPDFYALPACESDDRSHFFHVGSTVPSGAEVRFTLTLGTAEGGQGIGTCGGTLPTFSYVEKVP